MQHINDSRVLQVDRQKKRHTAEFISSNTVGTVTAARWLLDHSWLSYSESTARIFT